MFTSRVTMQANFWTVCKFTVLWTLISTLTGSVKTQGQATFWPSGNYGYNRDYTVQSDPYRVSGARSIYDQAQWPANTGQSQHGQSSSYYGATSRYSPYYYGSTYGTQYPPSYYSYLASSTPYRQSSYPYNEFWRFYSQYPTRAQWSTYSPSYPSTNYPSTNYPSTSYSGYSSYYRPSHPTYPSYQSNPSYSYPGYPSTGQTNYPPTSAYPGYPQTPSYPSYPSYPGYPSSGQPSYPPTSGQPGYPPTSGYPYSYGGYRYSGYGNQYPTTGYPSYPSPPASPWANQSPYPPTPPGNPPYSPWSDFSRKMGWLGMPGPQTPYMPPPYPRDPYQSHMPGPPPIKSVRSVAELHGPSGVTGTVVFKQIGSQPVSISGKIMGLAPGPHGMHILEMPILGNDCLSGGDHYNPQKTEHGGKHDWNRHVGDLGNIFADSNGVATFELTDLLISLSGGYSIVNRTLVVTEKPDDLGRGVDMQSKRNGNSGPPVACGVVRISAL